MNMEVEQHQMQEWYSSPAVVEESEKLSTCFDCCICLDNAHDPVVTLCGHLYCWSCIYKWLQFQGSSLSSGNQTLCPICKVEISHTSVVPIYGRGEHVSETELNDKATSLKAIIPPRPAAFARRSWTGGQPFQNENDAEVSSSPPLFGPGSTIPAAACRPAVGMFEEMVYARVFGIPQSLYTYPNSYYSAGRINPRMRRQEIETHKSLYRVSFFLFCCLLLCLFLF